MLNPKQNQDMLKPTFAVSEYHSAHKRFVKPLIEHFFETELPRTFGPELRSTIADRLLDIFLSCYKDTTGLKPGQILWNAVHKNTRADSKNVRFVPVVLTMVSDDDISNLEKGLSAVEHRQNVIARITQEAYSQNALLSMRDISLFMAMSPAMITVARKQYEEKHNMVMPHVGSLQDVGCTITHKYQIVYKYVVGKKDPTIIAKETNHSQKAVDHYIQDYNRVKLLYSDNKDINYIKTATNIAVCVIKQYISIIEQYVKEPLN